MNRGLRRYAYGGTADDSMEPQPGPYANTPEPGMRRKPVVGYGALDLNKAQKETISKAAREGLARAAPAMTQVQARGLQAATDPAVQAEIGPAAARRNDPNYRRGGRVKKAAGGKILEGALKWLKPNISRKAAKTAGGIGVAGAGSEEVLPQEEPDALKEAGYSLPSRIGIRAADWANPVAQVGPGPAETIATGARNTPGTEYYEQQTGFGTSDIQNNAVRGLRDAGVRGAGMAQGLGEGILSAGDSVAQFFSENARVPSGRDIYDYYANKLGYAEGGRVGLRQGYERGGRASKFALESDKQQAKRLAQSAPKKRPPSKAIQATVESAEQEAERLARSAPKGPPPPKALRATVESTPPRVPAPQLERLRVPETTTIEPVTRRKPNKTIEAPEMKTVSEGPKVQIGSKAQPRARLPLETPEEGLRERMVRRAREIVGAQIKRPPQTKEEATKVLEKVSSTLGPAKKSASKWALKKTGKLGGLAALGYGLYELGHKYMTGEPSPTMKGLRAGAGELVERGERRLAGQPEPKPPSPAPPLAGADQSRAGTAAPAATVSPFLAEQGLSQEDVSRPAVPQGLRRTIVQEARPDPGAFINLGNYGGNANIYATSSTPGGRVNRFVGQGGVGAAAAPDVTPEMQKEAGLRAAQDEDRLTSAIQARLTSGADEDLEMANRLAVTPEQRALVNDAYQHRMLRQQAGTRAGRERLARYEEEKALRPARQLALAKHEQGLRQQDFENRLAIAKEGREQAAAEANIAKTFGEQGQAAFKNFLTGIDGIEPPTIDGKTNPQNAALKALILRDAASKGVSPTAIMQSPQLLAQYQRNAVEMAKRSPDTVDQILAQFGVGSATTPTAPSDVVPVAYDEGAFGPVVILPTGQRVAVSEYVRSGTTGIGLPFGLGAPFSAQDADRVREVEALRRAYEAKRAGLRQ